MKKNVLVATGLFGGLAIAGTVLAARSVVVFTPAATTTSDLIGKDGATTAGRPTERDPFRPGVRSPEGPGELPFPG